MDGLKTGNQNNEFSFMHQMETFWQQKWWILVITVFCFGLSAVYLAQKKPVYEAKVVTVPPTLRDISQLNVGRSSLIDYPLGALTVKDVYGVFANILLSEAVRVDLFNQIYLPSLTEEQRTKLSKDKLYANFLKIITIKEIPRTSPIKFIVTADANSPEKAKAWLEQFFGIIEKRTANELVQAINTQNHALAVNAKQEIESARVIAEKTKQDRIVQLKDALVISKSSGIIDSVNKRALDDDSMLYMRGSKSLQSELDVLLARKSNDAFTPRLRELENEYRVYNNLNVTEDSIKSFRFDGAIFLPESPIQPKSSLILMLGLICGLICGSAVALIRTNWILLKAMR
ncbi:LPS O-antigen chain length determinant protein WzzB [uncultured Legionella sp.]|uniref:LPS O-antigen chain length determinant protein WzzB n=1 Tax=uncultured Legionella sp. TaxID=210934 RepID=UPI0026365E16|nr:Wzz/FepE/Etk N-terminal domain-containing protein [uncultured Legionella sp.]